eukprot:6858693-Prymnesium_polylepis.1
MERAAGRSPAAPGFPGLRQLSLAGSAHVHAPFARRALAACGGLVELSLGTPSARSSQQMLRGRHGEAAPRTTRCAPLHAVRAVRASQLP